MAKDGNNSKEEEENNSKEERREQTKCFVVKTKLMPNAQIKGGKERAIAVRWTRLDRSKSGERQNSI